MLIELKQAARRLRRSPGFSLTAILSLALGLGAGAAAFSVIDAVRLRALPFRDGDRLVVVSETSSHRAVPAVFFGVPAPTLPGGERRSAGRAPK